MVRNAEILQNSQLRTLMMSTLISAIVARLTDSPASRYFVDGRVYKPDNLSDNESLVG